MIQTSEGGSPRVGGSSEDQGFQTWVGRCSRSSCCGCCSCSGCWCSLASLVAATAPATWELFVDCRRTLRKPMNPDWKACRAVKPSSCTTPSQVSCQDTFAFDCLRNQCHKVLHWFESNPPCQNPVLPLTAYSKEFTSESIVLHYL